MYILDFARNMFKAKNIGVIVYLVLNTLIFVALFGGFSNAGMAVFALLIYAVCILIALSPAGEWILRMQNGCKKIKRKDYLDRLMPLFNEVYAQAKYRDPSIADGVQLFMSNDAAPNAFATGRKTICVTKGFLSYTDDQIKGTLAHEFGHLAHKDTDTLLFITVGNMLMSAVFLIYRVIVNVVMFIVAIALDSIATLIGKFFIDVLLVFAMWCWTKIGLLLVMHASRKNEYEADQFAFELGYGNALAVVLDSFDDASDSKGLWANLHASHPDTNDRIARLQELGVTFRNAYGHSVQSINQNPTQYGYAHATPPVFPAPGTGYQQPAAAKPYAQPMGVAALAPNHMPQANYAPVYPQPQQQVYAPQAAYAQPMPPQQPMYGGVQQQSFSPVPPPVPWQANHAQPIPSQAPHTHPVYSQPVQPPQGCVAPALQQPIPPQASHIQMPQGYAPPVPQAPYVQPEAAPRTSPMPVPPYEQTLMPPQANPAQPPMHTPPQTSDMQAAPALRSARPLPAKPPRPHEAGKE